MRERKRTGSRYRVRKADGLLERRLERLDQPKPEPIGVYCPTCQQKTIPGAGGQCLWCERVIVLWDGTPIHEAAA